MGKIVIIMGKSSSGKDTIYNRIKNDKALGLKPIVLHTTRPKRDGEIDGETYHFVDETEYCGFKEKGQIIEERVYHTVYGDWRYFTVNSKEIDLEHNSYVLIGTIESYISFIEYYDKNAIVPVLVEVEDGLRLERALARERTSGNKKYREMCRRFIADCDDFSEEKILQAGISETARFENEELDTCTENIKEYIKKNI